jgi:hypothetical protein
LNYGSIVADDALAEAAGAPINVDILEIGFQLRNLNAN